MSSFSSKPFLCFGAFCKILRISKPKIQHHEEACHIPDGVREAICKMFQNGVKVSEIARNLSMSSSTVYNIVQQLKKTGESSKQKWHGRKPKLSIRQQRILGRMISANRKVPKQKILNEFNSGSEVKISMRTFERYSKKFGFRRRVLGKKQVLRRKHRLARLSWVRTRRLLTVESYWKRIIFSDECTVKVGQNFRV